jgi:phage terminase large subunit GpA-like protein
MQPRDDLEARINGFRASALKPRPKMTVSEWAEKYRFLSSISSPDPGRWRNIRTPYLKEVMDCFSDRTTEIIVCCFSTQVGKTEALLCCLGYTVDINPAPCMLVLPTKDAALKVAKTRIAPLFEETPVLQNRVLSGRGGETLLHKPVHGGYISICWGGSASQLASQPIKILIIDETDRLPVSVGKDGAEGSPIILAIQRTNNYRNRKICLSSTPTTEGLSPINDWFLQSDQRYFHVPCHVCGAFQKLVWAQVRWQRDEITNDHKPETAMYICESCEAPWDDVHRWRAVTHGHWVSTSTSNRVAGFHLNHMYSSWRTLEDIVKDFITSKNRGSLKEFINTSLAEVWKEDSTVVEVDELYSRREPYDKDTIPDGCVVLTAGVDIQDNVVHVLVLGHGHNEERWVVDYHIINGSPLNEAVWGELAEFLTQGVFYRQDGTCLKISATAVDSGHFTQRVYKFVKQHKANRIFSIKGVGGRIAPIVSKRPTKSLYLVGTHVCKERIYSQLKAKEEGFGYVHFGKNLDEGFFKELTSEKLVTRYIKGFPTQDWFLRHGQRNEALDCMVYALAAREILQPNYSAIEINNKKQTRDDSDPPPEGEVEVTKLNANGRKIQPFKRRALH